MLIINYHTLLTVQTIDTQGVNIKLKQLFRKIASIICNTNNCIYWYIQYIHSNIIVHIVYIQYTHLHSIIVYTYSKLSSYKDATFIFSYYRRNFYAKLNSTLEHQYITLWKNSIQMYKILISIRFYAIYLKLNINQPRKYVIL